MPRRAGGATVASDAAPIWPRTLASSAEVVAAEVVAGVWRQVIATVEVLTGVEFLGNRLTAHPSDRAPWHGMPPLA